MKLLFVNSGLRFGGAETQIINLATRLVQRGHEVTLYLLSQDVPRLHELDGTGVKVIVGNKSRKFDFRELKALHDLIVRTQPDVIKSFLFDANFYARLASLGTGIKVVNGERGHGYTLRFSQKLAHYPTRHLADAVVANTHAGRTFARNLFGMADQHAHVVWNGIDVARIRTRAQPREDLGQSLFQSPDARVMCFVGALRPVKDVKLAVRVAEVLAAKAADWRFVFVGDTVTSGGYKAANVLAEEGYKGEVLAEVQARGLQPRCAFLGERKDAVRLIASSDVLLCTSVHEGFPNVVLEAMTVGTPVISSDVSDIRRILPNAWQVVSQRDPEAFAAAVERACRERAEVVAQQQAFVDANATLDRACEAFESVLSKYAQHAVAR